MMPPLAAPPYRAQILIFRHRERKRSSLIFFTPKLDLSAANLSMVLHFILTGGSRLETKAQASMWWNDVQIWEKFAKAYLRSHLMYGSIAKQRATSAG